jgi:hypothetical protein
VAWPRELLRLEPLLEVERILMMDYASTQAQAKGMAPTASHEEGHTKATIARPLKASPLPTTDEVDKMYHQLVEIHDIIASQLAECVRWCKSNPTSNVGHNDASWWGPTVAPAATRTAPQQALLW